MTTPGSSVPQDLRDASRVTGATGRVPPSSSRPPGRVTGPGAPCDWCGEPIPDGARIDAETCCVQHRKARWRFRQGAGRVPPRPVRQVGPAARFAYADPPYPGRADYYVERQEVDHAELIAGLERDFPDGWALSTAADALHDVLPLCPPEVRVCVWRRRTRPTRSRRALSAWEPLLVVGGRELATDEPQELLDVLDYRGRYDAFPGALIGMKPPEFSVWLFRQLGARTGDELVDVFPGSGAVRRAWELYASAGPADASRLAAAERDASRPTSRGTRPGDPRDASPVTAASRDASPTAAEDASDVVMAPPAGA